MQTLHNSELIIRIIKTKKVTTADPKINLIHEVIQRFLPGARIILFGSRAKGIYDIRSDYDVMAIIHEDMNKDEIRGMKQNIRGDLAEERIAIDIFVTSDAEIKRISELTNHIVNEALATGVEI